MIHKTQIQTNFTRHARHYDQYAVVQEQVGQCLAGLCPETGVHSILDIGCGTGTFTRQMRDQYPEAHITAVDLCPTMIQVAREKLGTRHVTYCVTDAETLSLTESYDLIVSNACMQWFASLDRSMVQYSQALSTQGMLAFSVFGPETFCELAHALGILQGRPLALSAQGFYSTEQIECYARRVFDQVHIQRDVIEQPYKSVLDLLKAIKYTGTKGRGVDVKQLSRSDIQGLDAVYRATYGRIVATYEVFYCTASGV